MRPNQERADRLTDKLTRELGPDIVAALSDDLVTEVLLDESGTLWLERMGQALAPFGTMPAHQAESLMNTVASSVQSAITRDRPILECELPLDGSRFSACIPPVALAPVFSIRCRPRRVFTLDEYVASGSMTQNQRELITGAVLRRDNIIVAGGTGSGKTTVVNAIIEHISAMCPDDRIVVIEDTREIKCAARNRLMLRTDIESGQDMIRLLRHTLRQRPDRIVVGEVRGPEALALLKAWNTGHPGGASTLHCDGAHLALPRLESLIAEASAIPMQRLICEAVKWVVYVERLNGVRRVQTVQSVTGWDGSRYLVSTPEQ